MKPRTSRLAQTTFDVDRKLAGKTRHGGPLESLLARAVRKFGRPIVKWTGSNHTVTAQVYSQTLIMPAEHPIAATMAAYPQYNRPLGLASVAIAETSSGSALAIVDVGANIGDTAALIEQWRPGVFSYLCLEPDANLAEMCAENHRNNSRVTVSRSFIGEDEGAAVRLENDGRASPSTILLSDSVSVSDQGALVRLDTAVLPFARAHGRLDLIKIDTEGYDFSVLRSGPELLKQYQPTLFFEWFPGALRKANQDFYAGFEYLRNLGYRYFVFFTAFGDYYCNSTDPDTRFLRGLATIAEAKPEIFYFDVFASVTEPVSTALIDLSISINEKERFRRD